MPRQTPVEEAENGLADERLLYLRQLLSVIQRDQVPGFEGERVMMDIDLDGQRYILVAMPEPDTRMASLSPREIEIARLVSMGHPNKVIAAVLEISSWTVCTHLRRMFVKLSVNSRAAMVAKLADSQQSFGRGSLRHAAALPVRAGRPLPGAEDFAELDDGSEVFPAPPPPALDERRPRLTLRPAPLVPEPVLVSRRATFAR